MIVPHHKVSHGKPCPLKDKADQCIEARHCWFYAVCKNAANKEASLEAHKEFNERSRYRVR